MIAVGTRLGKCRHCKEGNYIVVSACATQQVVDGEGRKATNVYLRCDKCSGTEQRCVPA